MHSTSSSENGSDPRNFSELCIVFSCFAFCVAGTRSMKKDLGRDFCTMRLGFCGSKLERCQTLPRAALQQALLLLRRFQLPGAAL